MYILTISEDITVSGVEIRREFYDPEKALSSFYKAVSNASEDLGRNNFAPIDPEGKTKGALIVEFSITETDDYKTDNKATFYEIEKPDSSGFRIAGKAYYLGEITLEEI